jgi:hypothetical protein
MAKAANQSHIFRLASESGEARGQVNQLERKQT